MKIGDTVTTPDGPDGNQSTIVGFRIIGADKGRILVAAQCRTPGGHDAEFPIADLDAAAPPASGDEAP